MATPNNLLQVVSTYQMSELAWLLNENVFLNLSNKKFDNFQNLTGNLGQTVTWDLPPKSRGVAGLIAVSESAQQRVQSMSCTQAFNISNSFTSQQRIFQLDANDYLNRFARSRIKELGTNIETDMLKNIVSGVIVNDPQNANFGTNITPESGPYRFYGNGVAPIDSYGQLAQAMTNFRNFGSANWDYCGLLPDTIIPGIINSGLTQFATKRNDENAMSWELGPFSNAEWYQSNLLPTHVAGSAGNSAATLTLVSTNDPTGTNITQLTFSSTLGNDSGAIKSGDMFQFNDGVAGQPNMRFRQQIGHGISAQPVQFRATADAASIGGVITVDIFPPLVSVANLNQNLSSSLAPGMEVSVLPTHLAGVIWSGDSMYSAMPRLDDQSPFSTVITTDEDSGASLRTYYGAQLGLNNSLYTTDAIWGSSLQADNTMRVIIPV